jgi:prepilin-type N-terminal cleavage/methylation domain-containing protein
MTSRPLTSTQITADDGFSLAEVLIVTLLLGFILAAAYMAMGTVSKVSDDLIARTSAQEQGQLAVEKMTREMRMGQALQTPGTTPVETRFPQNSATVVSFYADANHDGTLSKITYTLSGNQITRQEAIATKSYPLMPDTSNFGANSAATVLAKVDPSLTSVFTYLDNTGAAGASQGNATAVQIKVKTLAGSGASQMIVDIPTATVNVRSFQ